MHVKKGDTVTIIAGKDKGKSGTVTKVFVDTSRVSVDVLSPFKRHSKSKRQGEKGGIIEVPGTIHSSNVALKDKKAKTEKKTERKEKAAKKTAKK